MAIKRTIATITRIEKPMKILVAIMRAERSFFFLAFSIRSVYII